MNSTPAAFDTIGGSRVPYRSALNGITINGYRVRVGVECDAFASLRTEYCRQIAVPRRFFRGDSVSLLRAILSITKQGPASDGKPQMITQTVSSGPRHAGVADQVRCVGWACS